MAKNRKGKKSVKFTVKTPKVKKYIDFLCIPKCDRKEGEKTVYEFMLKNKIADYSSLTQYKDIPGFKEAVQSRKVDLMVEVAESGLYQNAKGYVQIRKTFKGTEVDPLTGKAVPKESERQLITEKPDTGACRTLLEMFGGLKTEAEKSNANNKAIFDAADALSREEDEADGDVNG